MKVAIITGASSGIGYEAALEIDRRFKSLDEIWILARSEDKLRKLSYKMNHAVRIFTIDLLKEEELKEFKKKIIEIQPNVKMLFLGAGEGLHGKFSTMKREDETEMIKLNCVALTDMVSICLPFMKRRSHIISVASSAGFIPCPGFGVYAASKAYVKNFSLALRSELRSRKIYVTTVCPGPVDTPFFDRSERVVHKIGKLKKFIMNKPERVARKAICDAGFNRKYSFDTPFIAAFCFLASLVF